MTVRTALHGPAFLYSGHGSGAKYYSYEQMLAETEPFSAVSLLMGCSSLRMGTRGNWTHIGAPLYYALNRCPVVVGCLWDVSDGDLDRMTKFMLNSVMVGMEWRT
ncbi:hypothetical protein BLSTO_01148 [Blastocystis sp. subtype 1]